jgi:hypothetical protein
MSGIEEWRDIPKWEGYYQASSLGRIRSKDRTQFHSRTFIAFEKKGKIRKLQEHPSGYKTVRLCKKGKCSTLKVHRLVCSAFYGESIGEVNHKDGDKGNNEAINLEWCTRAKNIQHSYELGLASQKGEDNSRAKLTREKVSMIYCLIEWKFTNASIARVFNVSESTISAIKNGRNWK